ncbi:MAG: PIN domain-containing protein [Flavobacteriales bacterium]
MKKTKVKLFIDANIYLRFYDSNQESSKSLLKNISAVKDSILVTAQVVDEVKRNKANVFSVSFANYIAQMKQFGHVRLPDHLDVQDVTEWNGAFKELGEKHKALSEKLYGVRKSLLKKIVFSIDDVSVQLKPVFDRAIQSTSELIQMATERRSLGRPPGKWSDPLGDQLNWEVLLPHIRDVSQFILISNDFDFFASGDKDEQLLNPVLYDEMRAINASIEVRCTNSLSDGLELFNEWTGAKVSQLPSGDELEKIKEEEVRFIPFSGGTATDPTSGSSGTTSYYNDSQFKRREEIERIKYLYKNSLIRRKEAESRLITLGVSLDGILDILDNRIVY